MTTEIDQRVAIAQDVDAPDKILYGLTARQAAILAGTAAVLWLVYKALTPAVPPVVLLAVAAPIGALAAAVALGRRDGLPLDRWLAAALAHQRTRRRAVPAKPRPAPAWAPAVSTPDTGGLGPLRLPAKAIADTGTVDLDGGATALVAASTVNIALRTPDEQAALIGGYARWLNALTGPTQVVVSAQRVDLTGHADRVAAAADLLAHPALADAALDYADFLLDVAETRDPLWRTVTIACTDTGAHAPATTAMRRAEHTATALAALGLDTRVLDGTTVTAVLAAAVDPYQYTDASWPRTTPGSPVTAAPFEEMP